MPSSSTGKWVSRAAATGGGRSYRGKTPTNWYLGLAIILVLGLLSVGFARYEYGRSSSSPPKATTWYAGIAFDRCGAVQPALAASPSSSGVAALGSGVIAASLQNRSQATLGRFVTGYPGLTLTSSAFGYPGKATLHSGQACPTGTPDAGKKGQVEVVYWTNFSQTKSHVVSDPASLSITNGQLITAAFVPAGTTLSKPPKSTVSAVLSSIAGSPPTTTAPSTTTTAPSTSTTAPSTTTTAPSTTTTTAPASTTTTKGK